MSTTRREFLAAMGGIAGLSVLELCGPGCAPRHVGVPKEQQLFPILEVTGSHREIGRGMGETFREFILEVLDSPDGAAIAEAARNDSIQGRLQGFLEVTRARFPHLIKEVEGLAEGVGRPFLELFTWNCRSEIQVMGKEPEGCSTVGVADASGFMLAHNEDGAAMYLKRMFVLRASPPSGVSFAYLVYPGTLPGVAPGVNARGVFQTTNYIAPKRVVAGVPRYFPGRTICEAGSLDEALALALSPDRAFPWHHNLGSLTENRLLSVETWPGLHSVHEVEGLLLHTNHLLHAEMDGLEEDRSYLNQSSLPRYEALVRLTKERVPETREEVLTCLADRSGEPCKLCRLPGDPVPGVTEATAFFQSGRVEMELLESTPCYGASQIVRP